MSRAVRLDKPWLELTTAATDAVGGYMGVYQLADIDEVVTRIGYAGGSSPFGLRGVLRAEADAGGRAVRFRYEITTAYLSRYRELLMTHVADHGRLPVDNHEDPASLGRLRPS